MDEPEDLHAIVNETACRWNNGCVTDSDLELAAVAVNPNTRDNREIDDGGDSFVAK